MSIEAKLIEHLQGGLSAFESDAEALTELARRAVEKALFAETREYVNYGYQDRPAPAVAAAQAIAKQAAESIVAEQVERLKASPEFLASVREALAAAMPEAIKNQCAAIVSWQQEQGARDAVNRVCELVRSGGLK